jgi:signal transduction histidine kinase/ActR/RegA family two-component response regulator
MRLSYENRGANLISMIVFHAIAAVGFVLFLGLRFFQLRLYSYLGLSIVLLVFGGIQMIVLKQFQKTKDDSAAAWKIIWSLTGAVLILPAFLRSEIIPSIVCLSTMPMFAVACGRLKQLPSILFLTFVVTAAAILIEQFLPATPWILKINSHSAKVYVILGFLCYAAYTGWVVYQKVRRNERNNRLQINVATQYALVITVISAMVVLMVSGVMIAQIRKTQMDQAGSTFQTIAENFATLVGSQIEQQTHKLHLLTQQVPIFKESLINANGQYANAGAARNILENKNKQWKGPLQDDAFVMNYLNNPMIRALSLFRGHNSFHNDLVLIDRYGGLVGSLGRKPENLYFFDQVWWTIAWNNGLGNIFIGDLALDDRTQVPKIRIAVDIVDNSTNEHIGILSSIYLLRTLMEDIQRTKPDTVDQISLIDAQGRVIISTVETTGSQKIWSQLNDWIKNNTASDSGWVLGKDHIDQAALIGFSSLSTVYSVISDPLHRLGWHIVVSGSRSRALQGVTQSTKMAMVVGLLVMALGVLGGIAAARVITRPIENLTQTASAMSEGSLDNRAELKGPEELVTLSAGFNQLADRLNKVIRDLKIQAGQLVIAKQEAEAATKLKGEFLAKMSHEIRTPLNAILGFADILESSIQDARQKRHTQIIQTSGRDLLHLINDILDLSKIEAGRMEIHNRPVSIRSLFEELSRIFSISAAEKRIQLEMNIASNMPDQLMLDQVRLRQVLFNLIGNAVKFTKQGRVQCRARIRQGNSSDRVCLIIEVRDTGIGIPSSIYSQIFNAFEQHPGDANGTLEGTGLGLAISKSLIEMMNGSISVKSHEGKESEFTVRLPDVAIVLENELMSETSDLNHSNRLNICFHPATILIADDLDINRHLVIEALKGHPLTIHQAVDGNEAIHKFKKTRFDLILMDIRMPILDGYQALENIRKIQSQDLPPVIAITAGGMKEDIRRMRNAGFDDYLIRPFDKFNLTALLTKFLSYETEDHGKEPENDFMPMTEDHVMAYSPWVCPMEYEDFVLNHLTSLWRQAAEKQSIPNTVEFANQIKAFGEKLNIVLLSQYGNQLKEAADAFDVQSVENLLSVFETIITCRISDT